MTCDVVAPNGQPRPAIPKLSRHDMTNVTSQRPRSLAKLTTVCLLFGAGGALEISCVPFQSGHERRLSLTQGIEPSSAFNFTISPNDRWLVYFQGVTPEEVGTRHNRFGNLRVLDLRSGQVLALLIPNNAAPDRLVQAEAPWTIDNSSCILPPPSTFPFEPQLAICIDFSDAANISASPARVTHGDKAGVEGKRELAIKPQDMTCSDCSPHLNDVKLLKKHVDSKHLTFGDLSWNLNGNASQVVSFDGTKIFYQEGRGTSETTLVELDIASGVVRALTSHKGDCATIDRLRPSPDGRMLAYQLTTGCDFVGPSPVFVLDLETRDRRQVGTSSGGTMHWTSTSDRLFYYRSKYLYVVEFPKPSSQPTTRPADTPPPSKPHGQSLP